MATMRDPIPKFQPQRKLEFLHRVIITSAFQAVGLTWKKERIKISLLEYYRYIRTDSSETGNPNEQVLFLQNHCFKSHIFD